MTEINQEEVTIMVDETPSHNVDLDALRANIAPVEPTDNMAEAGRKILLADFVKMLEHEAGSRTGDDIEDVHQMRVATRRMRSAFILLEPYFKTKPTRPFVSGLRDVARALGAVRDLDVLLEDMGHQRQALDVNDAVNLQGAIDALKKRRRKARKKLVALLDSASYRQFVKAYAAFLTKPGRGAKSPESATDPHQVRHVLPREIHAHLADVRAYDTVLDGAPPATIHALRIEFKRLRYVIDYFEDVLGASGTAYEKEIKRMQDLLGRYNDIDVAHQVLGGLLENGKFKAEDKAAVEAYLQHITAESHEIEAKLPAAWAHFNTRAVQQKLANALLVLR